MTQLFNQRFQQFVLLNEANDILHDGPEIILFDAHLGVGQTGHNIRHHVVQGVALLGQLGEEELGPGGDLVLLVHNAECNVTDLSFNLDVSNINNRYNWQIIRK